MWVRTISVTEYSVSEDENKETMNHDEDHLSSRGSDEEKEEASLEETLPGEYSSVVHSHWSRSNEARLSLVNMVHSVAPPVSLTP